MERASAGVLLEEISAAAAIAAADGVVWLDDNRRASDFEPLDLISLPRDTREPLDDEEEGMGVDGAGDDGVGVGEGLPR